ncbi:sensor histidine kinase, HAMP domain-containing [Citrifermentans bemidjiense Bem]|uniref:histidine kinase n=1 Tax=Citrifermentans bemidjiense (strain ATCC BAA-1014 / DSM 16622 / JCM 12645 / Bem) TaxID=404380 RepID=B5EC01_CITBB|nr:heavy metal sensor histidine kinase [Citrifermentans bemidjiense]ACH40457.1 sensor histidine kinase, HAMP domain-containing [Citrifermentans bemidjiense Bem]
MKIGKTLRLLKKGILVDRPGAFSIAHNLAMVHILTILVAFTVCATLLYFKIVEQLDQSANAELRSEIASIRTLLFSSNGVDMLRNSMQNEAESEEVGRHSILLRLLDKNGNPLLEGKNLKGVPIAAFPLAGDCQLKKYRAEDGKLYLIRNAALHDPLSQSNGWRLQIAVDLSPHERLAASYRTYLILFGFGGLLFAIPSSLLVVRHGLKPLNDLSDTIAQVTDDELGTRLNPAIFPVEMQSLANSFNTMMDTLETSFQRLSHYSGNLAHELRTPIGNLMLQTEIALSKERTPEAYREVLASALEEYTQLSLTIDRLLFLARADSNNNDLLLQRLAAEGEASEVIDYFSEEAAEAGITLECRGAAVIAADRTLFRRALSNLVSNAISHTPSGGVVSVTIRPRNDGSVEVDVSDTGCGIEAKHLPMLFDRFYRIDQEVEGELRVGTGLGLAIVKAIMTMHRGRVLAWSKLGKGTTITMRFNHRQ